MNVVLKGLSKGLFAFFLSIILSPLAAKELAVEHFFKNPDFSQLQISPSGKYLAALAPLFGHRNIVVMETADLRNAKALTGMNKYDITTFFWANDDRIVFTFDKEGEEAFGLYAVDRSGG